MKLQDAYAAEAGAVGLWANIGYIGPGSKVSGGSNTTVFDYGDVLAGTSNGSIMIGNLTEDKPGWTAKNKTALNDCGIQSTWTIKIKGGSASTGSTVVYTAEVPDAVNGACGSLTANFTNIGK